MRAMVLDVPNNPLRLTERAVPRPGAGQMLIRVEACGVCRTDLHLVDGELPSPMLPVIPGHEIVGRVAALGEGVVGFAVGQRVGVPWLGWTCGECEYCLSGQENLCDAARFTGYTLDGGYAEFTVADQRYCFALPDPLPAAELAPLLCAGLIGYRALAMAGDARRVGIYGFGAAAHIVAQVLRHQGRAFYAFTRRGDDASQAFAAELGAAWCGAADELPPVALDAALIFAPAGELVPAALRAVRKGGTVVCAGIHMSDIPAFPYDLLWGERVLRSVANLTRADGDAFLRIVAESPVRTHVTPFALEQANDALDALRAGRLQGAAVLLPGWDGRYG
ncbi:zinc-binding alcohol dehydrogenase family protein [Azoarcus communis]|uniref:alcohol dehydrogenase n=1 Tax=Parazoarcus communis SWub3 = DSM 12120 TaxID=1121029 RepID=A0A323V1A3_9RHOO|nr:zinc-dependent alcohol dehydrogenase family protein [Parazoarcus communis]NMG49613.1 zinc-binding alcohol dehydrogenase family protein [Parazoarcus communis]NMG68613.1 zinc-binding alcohol dehydrogenase family protein [Parazoarcus communis SWub3 = DSM 12120]PZA17750.1 alcohol dehydrogenase [Azoarcus communis] [Parazoarcus communis SWub3 = DSM 12120]